MKKIKKLLTIGFAIMCICGSLTACSEQDNTISEQITTINTTITEMQTLDSTLDGYIDTLESKVATLETDLSIVNTTLESLYENSATVTALTETRTALETQINVIKADITALKAKDSELDGKITALQTALSTEITDTEKWVSDTFTTKTACETLKTEINATISTIQEKISGLETSISTLSSSVTALQEQVQQNKKDIDELKNTVIDLQNQINCLHGKHVAKKSETNYFWSDDYSTCKAVSRCEHCDFGLSEEATTTWGNDYYWASFRKYGIETAKHNGKSIFTIGKNESCTFENVMTITNNGTENAYVKIEVVNYESYYTRLDIDAGGNITLEPESGNYEFEYATINGCVLQLYHGYVHNILEGDLFIADGKTTCLGNNFTNNTGNSLTLTKNGFPLLVTLTGEQSIIFGAMTLKNGTIKIAFNTLGELILGANSSIDVISSFYNDLNGTTEIYMTETITAGNADCSFHITWERVDIYSGSLTIQGITYSSLQNGQPGTIIWYGDYVEIYFGININGIDFETIDGTAGWALISVNSDGSFTVIEDSVKITLDAGETAVVNGQTYSGGENGATFEIIVE